MSNFKQAALRTDGFRKSGKTENTATSHSLRSSSEEHAVYHIAGKAVMAYLLGAGPEAAEYLETDLKIVRTKISGKTIFDALRIDNVRDFPDFSSFHSSDMRSAVERFFLIVSAGVWAKSIRTIGDINLTDPDVFDRAAVIAAAENAITLSALRSILSKTALKSKFLAAGLIEQSLLDYEAVLYRHSFAIVSSGVIWPMVNKIAVRLKEKKIITGTEIAGIVGAVKDVSELKRELAIFYRTV